MSYCRFSDADIYLYDDIDGINCCTCNLAPKVKTRFTTGGKFFSMHLEPCEHCNGEGCDACMVHSNTHLYTKQEALEHVRLHREKGDHVPEYVDEALRADE